MPDPFAGLFDLAVETYNKLTEQVETESPPEDAFACKAGCEHCCYQQPISVTPIEVFHIANHVRKTFSEAEFNALMTRFDRPVPSIEFGGLTACPFLVDHNCSIHADRPFACRSANSYNAEECRQAARNGFKGKTISTYQGHYTATQYVLDALYKAIRDSKLENGIFNFRSAVAIALKDTSAEEKWRQGQEVFGANCVAGHRQ